MGVSHSVQNPRDYEPPPLPSPFGPGGPFQGFPRGSRASSQSSVASNLQHPEPRQQSLRNDEWWHQPPSTINLQKPHEALLTYATQMTGFHPDYASGVPSPYHQEAMDLTRTVSHLAAANQQLASAHSALLSQLEALYLELSKERESGRKGDGEIRRRVEVIEGAVGYCQCSRKVDDDWRAVKKKEEDAENVKKEYQRAVERIQVLEGELKGGGLEQEAKEVREVREANRRLRRELERMRKEHEASINGVKLTQETSRILDAEKKSFKDNSIQTDPMWNRKYGDELEESHKEIQRLSDIVTMLKSVKNTDAATSTEIEDPQPVPLEVFKQDLCLRREARQRAIAAVSSEMDRLRRDLDAEKEAHSETSRVLDLLKTQSEMASRVETSSIGTTTISLPAGDSKPMHIDPNSLQRDAQHLTDVLKISDELRGCIRLQLEKMDDLRYHLECDLEANHHRVETLKSATREHREGFEIREHQMNRLRNVLSQILARLGDEDFRIEINEDLRNERDRQVEDIRRLKNLYDERMRVLIDLKESAIKEVEDTRQQIKSLGREKEALDEDLKKAEEKIDVQNSEVANLESQLGLTKADCRDLQNQMALINSLFSQMLLSASSADMDLDRLTQLLQENHDLISDMAREEGTEAAALPKLLLDLVEQVEGREKSKSLANNSEKKDDESQEESIANNLPKVWKVLTELLSCHAAGSSSTSSTLLSNDPTSCYKSVDTPTGPRLVISVSKTYIRLKELILEKKHLEKEMGRMKQLNTHLESKLGEQEKRLSTVSDELSKTWNVVGRMQAQHQQLHTHEKILRYELQQKRKMLQELKQELEYCREKWESARQKNTNTEIEWKNLRREFAARKALANDSFSNSAESGFSDDRCDDSDDEAEERVRAGPRRRTRKESPRAPTPDTESEQPTDTEVSDPKTESTTPEQRTPTPEISDSSSTESLRDPLDQALAKVIQNLIDDNQPTLPTSQESSEPSGHSPEDEKSKNSAGKTVQFSDPLVVGPSTEPESSLFGSSNAQGSGVCEQVLRVHKEVISVEEDIKEGNNEGGLEVQASEIQPDSPSVSNPRSARTPEEVMAARDARLKRLEEQAEWLMKKMSATSRRGSALSTRLEELHEAYGEAPVPPPMPDVLPPVRIPIETEIMEEPHTPQSPEGSSK